MDEAYEQVGSIYSVQGFEFDDVGLIWGDDLVWRDGKWVAQLEFNKDNAFKKELRNSGGDPVEKLRNVYRVLLTRGMMSTQLFVLDEETRAHVRDCLAVVPVQMAAVAGERAPWHDVDGAGQDAPRRGATVLPFRARVPALRLVDPTEEGEPAARVPVVELAAAAGGFGPERIQPGFLRHQSTWATWEGAPQPPDDAFVAKVEGRSMEPVIPSGAWCLFRAITLESVSGRPVLVWQQGSGDDGDGGYTVKDLTVQYDRDADGRFVRHAVTLRPRNPEFETLRFSLDGSLGIRVVAEVVHVFGGPAA